MVKLDIDYNAPAEKIVVCQICGAIAAERRHTRWHEEQGTKEDHLELLVEDFLDRRRRMI